MVHVCDHDLSRLMDKMCRTGHYSLPRDQGSGEIEALVRPSYLTRVVKWVYKTGHFDVGIP